MSTSHSDESSHPHAQELSAVGTLDEQVRDALEALGVTDVDQLAALREDDRVRPHLAEYLQVDPDELDRVTGAAEYASARTAAPAPTQHLDVGFGVLEPTPAMRMSMLRIPIAAVTPVALPTSVNLVAKFPPIRNQGQRGTCVAFATTAIHEFADGAKHDYSEQYLYFEIKLIDGSPAACGTWQQFAARVLAGKGQCLEKTWHYNPGLPCNQGGLPAGANAEAAHHKVKLAAMNPNDVNAIRAALSNKKPVGISIPVYNSIFSAATCLTGRITMRVGTEPQIGGHALCVVGYQDDHGAVHTPGGGFFIVRNSWGTTQWGTACPFGAGYGTIPYAYISGSCWEAFQLA
jgi:hypothetical protein